MALDRARQLQTLRAQVARIEGREGRAAGVLPFGDPRVDGCLPGGGLPLGRWHELGGEGMDAETGVFAAAFGVRLTSRLADRGQVVWVLQREDLHAPGLAGLGLPPHRLIYVAVRSDEEALAALEDALRVQGVAAAWGEIDRVDLTAGRRLQLACERHGSTGFVLRRRLWGRRTGGREQACAAATRWSVGPAPSDPGEEPGLGAPRWRVRLERAQGGRAGAWIMEANENGAAGWEANDATNPVRVVAPLADHPMDSGPAEPPALPLWRAAG
jgi:protein ImuA